MNEYRDDRQGLREQIAELEAALARAELRADRHVVSALRAREIEHENEVLREQLKEQESLRLKLFTERKFVIALVALVFIAVVAFVVFLARL